ncbi:zinc finger protein 37-like [Episyrphus balteatus]|uniref:zinc finger protein 37-like n=1 Tax=Episyrphus balteatus TaxID=286459 RepID=UPI0024856410|nr:zinc finger protein 37-like [Episyrphus balteatus]
MGRESHTCRVCTKRSKDFVELESIYVRKPQITYLEIYNICTQLNAIVDDELPKTLCSSCRKELKSSYKFIEKARETDKRLRETLCVHRSTRRSRRIEKEEEGCRELNKSTTPSATSPQHETHDVEPDFEEIKPEFINCTKDPLEDSDLEVNEKSEDEMDWVPDVTDSLQTDGFAEEKTAIIEDDDEDDKPLKQLIEKRKLEPLPTEPDKSNPDYDSSDVFNDLPEPADDDSSENENDVFRDKMMEVIPDPPTTQEAQIFPQGRYMCKICKKTYFTAEGLKAHMNVHMPKKKKVKRIRGPNKKNSKNKKKKKNASDEEGDGEDDEALEEKDAETAEKNEGENEEVSKEEVKGDESTTVEVKKKRKIKPPKPKKMFPCSVCGKHMISASKLRYHMVMHTGEKDFLCTMCPKAYSTIYALKHHMRTHTGERPYECNFCGDKFTRPTTLKSHMRRHTGERPYGCDICGKRFIQHSSMTTHMKLNHMAKTIACPHCDKKYARQTDLNTHLLSHTGDKPFSCSICPSRFIRQANLNKHMNQHHLAKNKTSKTNSTGRQQIELKTDEPVPEQSMTQDGNSSQQAIEQNTEYVEQIMDRPTANIQFAGQSKIHSTSTNHMTEQEKIPSPTGSVANQFAGQVMQQKITAATTTSNKFDDNVMQQKINFDIATNQFNPVQQRPQEPNLPPLPKMVSVRSLARPLQKGPPVIARRGQETSTPPGSDESNSSQRFLPNAPLTSPTAATSQIRHQQIQQNNMLPPSTQQQQQQQRLPNNENSMPISMNIAGIPGGIPTHSMLGSSGVVHIGQHGQMGSVEHLKGIHPPVDNLTNLLGQVIDPERIGRSVEEMIPWNWSNTS